MVDGFNNPDVWKVGECMHGKGFPQYLESMSELETDYAGPGDPLRRNPLQISPYTDEQARTLGMIGKRDIWPIVHKIGNVITSDPAYFAALDSCNEETRGAYDDSVIARMKSVTASFWNLYNELGRIFSAAIAEPMLELLRDRLACVKAEGYPQLDIDDALNQPSWEPILKAAGVEIGGDDRPAQAHDPEPLGDDQAANGAEILVVLPSDTAPAPYEPSASEIEFALAFAGCSRDLNALERFDELQNEARTPILAEYETQILGLKEQVEEILGVE